MDEVEHLNIVVAAAVRATMEADCKRVCGYCARGEALTADYHVIGYAAISCPATPIRAAMEKEEQS